MKYGRDVYLCAVKLRKSPENQKDKLSLHILKLEKETRTYSYITMLTASFSRLSPKMIV